MYEKLKGEDSFWAPYFAIAEPSDLPYKWSDSEIEGLEDKALQEEILAYRNEVGEEWKIFSEFATEHSQYEGLTRELFDDVYEMVVSRCFGWSLPGTMIIPFADCLNHHNSDT